MLSFLNETFVADERTVMGFNGRVALKSYDLEGAFVSDASLSIRERRML